MEFHYQIDNEIKTVTIEPNGDHFQVAVGDKVYHIKARPSKPGQLDLEVEGRRWQAYTAHDGSRRYVAINGATWLLEYSSTALSRRKGPVGAAGVGSGSLEATMPSLVLEMLVAEGDKVERGQTLVILEAMKMETRLAAPHTGYVRHIHCAVGQVVERGQLLIELEKT